MSYCGIDDEHCFGKEKTVYEDGEYPPYCNLSLKDKDGKIESVYFKKKDFFCSVLGLSRKRYLETPKKVLKRYSFKANRVMKTKRFLVSMVMYKIPGKTKVRFSARQMTQIP